MYTEKQTETGAGREGDRKRRGVQTFPSACSDSNRHRMGMVKTWW